MKNTQNITNNSIKKPSTFDAYIARRSAHNERLISQAVSAIEASRFGNLTDYCKTVSAVVSEIREAKALDPISPFYRKIVRPLSYVTLLRNPNYRKIVEQRYNETRELAIIEEQEDTEDLKLKIASLLGQINLLKEKVHAIDAGRSSETVDDSEYQALLEKANSRIGFLLTMHVRLREHAGNAFQHNTEPNERQPIPGLHSYRGLIMSVDELDMISAIASDHPIQS
ncbi:hypothetical protein [Pseudomonas kurunegalensis]|uniref:hypothetical protein n=1 Tax=Pseudomonas kurunegalensis TaxID=485880 RepID=UPI00236362C8|nr:hypothetical protein [Pseudomonas kurunegalensis]